MTEARKNPERPIIGVGAVVFKDSKVLLIRRGKPPKEKEWSLPGGAQELGESAPEAAIREVQEETGLEVKVTGFVDVVDFIEHDDKGGIAFHYTLLDFAAEYVSGTLRAGSDAEDAQFFRLQDIDLLPLWSETKRIIKLAAHDHGLL